MIDLHSHVLPGLDDGVGSVADAVACCRIAAEDGIRTLVCTPHLREGFFLNTAGEIRQALDALRKTIAAQGIDLELLPGSEVHIASDLPDQIASGVAMTLNDNGKYLLLELPYRQYPVRIEDLVFSLKVAGVTPVLAHPERVRFFQDDLDRLETLVRMGCLGQLTSSSLTGTFGSRVQDLSEEMVRRRLVHVLGSDAHDVRHRPPRIAAARDQWAELAGAEEALRATETWSRRILRGDSLEPPEPQGSRASGMPAGWWSRFFRRH